MNPVQEGDRVTYQDNQGRHEGYVKELRGNGQAAVVEFPDSKILNWIVSVDQLRRVE